MDGKSKEYTTGLCYSLGIFRIRFIRKEIKLVTNYSEDMENNIRHYLRDGKILRCNWLCGKTTNYSIGGCNADGRDNETEKADKVKLHELFPEYTKLFVRKNGRTDLRLKDYN